MTSMVQLRWAWLALAVLAMSGPARADFLIPSDFQLFAVHPDANGQATERGKTLANISAYQGSLYVGYGDWAADTGPVHIRSLNPSTAAWSAPLLNFRTEAVSHYRQLGSNLYAPNVDPLGLPGVNLGGFAVGSPTGAWSQLDSFAATHVFDINQRLGSELWTVGSFGTQGAVWRSTDGGQTFTNMRLDNPAPGQPSFVFSQFRGAGILDGKVFVQRIDVNGNDVTSSLVFDGTAWSNGPDLLPNTNGFMFRPTNFLNELVYLDGDKSLGNVYHFDGNQAGLAYNEKLKDFFIADQRLFGLTESSQLIVTSDLTHWTVFGNAPTTASSLGVFGDRLYLGTNQASVLSAALPNGVAVPEPSSYVLVSALCVALFAGKRGFKLRSLRRPARIPPGSSGGSFKC